MDKLAKKEGLSSAWSSLESLVEQLTNLLSEEMVTDQPVLYSLNQPITKLLGTSHDNQKFFYPALSDLNNTQAQQEEGLFVNGLSSNLSQNQWHQRLIRRNQGNLYSTIKPLTKSFRGSSENNTAIGEEQNYFNDPQAISPQDLEKEQEVIAISVPEEIKRLRENSVSHTTVVKVPEPMIGVGILTFLLLIIAFKLHKKFSQVAHFVERQQKDDGR